MRCIWTVKTPHATRTLHTRYVIHNQYSSHSRVSTQIYNINIYGKRTQRSALYSLFKKNNTLNKLTEKTVEKRSQLNSFFFLFITSSCPFFEKYISLFAFPMPWTKIFFYSGIQCWFFFSSSLFAFDFFTSSNKHNNSSSVDAFALYVWY